MPTTFLDWSRFNTGGIGPERAFEAFTSQLFERWLRREYPSLIASYVLHGAGGDGGVEAFARLGDGTVVGLQSKWFPENLDDKRIAQIRGSIDTARRRYPALRRYVVAMPLNLTKGLGAEDRPKKGGVERWDDLVRDVATAYPGLVLVRWDEAVQLNELALAENRELKAFWFEGEFTGASLGLAWEKAEAKLGQRYLPDLHAVGMLDDTLRSDLWTQGWLADARRTVERAFERLGRCTSSMADFVRATEGKGTPDLRKAANDARASIDELLAFAVSLRTALECGPGRTVAPVPAANTFSTFKEELELFKKDEYHLHTLAEDALESASEAHGRLAEIANAVDESTRLRLVAGPAGCGKTHTVAHAVHQMIDGGAPALLLMAQGAAPSLGAPHLFATALDMPGWPLARILDGLEAIAILHQLSKPAGEAQGFARALVAVDGLEESAGWEQWSSMLADLVVESKRRPRLRVVVTARPETFERLDTPADVSRLFLSESGGTRLPETLDRYAERCKVDTREVPWLGWALRSPLEIRLLAEEFGGQRISAAAGATANLLTLFRRKLTRLENEARGRAASGAWSEGIDLVGAVVTGLSDLLIETDSVSVPDGPLLAKMLTLDPEFTAERVRGALRVLTEHGVVSVWWPPDTELRKAPQQYGLATRHVADFAVARGCFRAIRLALAAGGRVKYPSPLNWRPASATLFAAQLAETGTYVADVDWEDPPDGLAALHAEALTLVPFEIAQPRVGEIRALLKASTVLNRALVERLILPSSRIPGHPLGAIVLDEALRSLPLADRDIFWSVPDDLGGKGPWTGSYNRVLDDIALTPKADRWDGRPLILAWTCSSVVEARRSRARERLAVWGARRLDEMARLVERMSTVDDAQVVGDVMVAALGAAAGAKLADPALVPLARLVDELFFAEKPRVETTSVLVRIAARGIVERTALLFPGEVDSLARCRPPYAPRGEPWPSLHPDETRQGESFGGCVVFGDLSWYVAGGCFDRFDDMANEPRPKAPPEVAHSLLEAIEKGDLAIPPETADGVIARSAEAMEKEAAEWIAAALERQGEAAAYDPAADPRHSPEFLALMRHASEVVGGTVHPKGVRNGMIASMVRGWGWSEEKFSHGKFDDPAETVDRAIVKTHGMGATHGSRSPVCTFREKYVWAAVDMVAGALADRMPVWSEDDNEWRRLSSFDDIGNGMPDPLPHLLDDRSGQGYPTWALWEPPNALPERFADETDLARRSERWLLEAPLPEPSTLVGAAVEGFPDAAILSLSHFTRGHQSCVDQQIQVRAFGVPIADIELLARDAPLLHRDLSDSGAWVKEGVYVSPALACWAPWLSWVGTDQGYNSVGADGAVRRVSVMSMVGQFTTRFEGDWPREQTTWIASPYLARALGIMAMRGGRYGRVYSDRAGSDLIVEYDAPSAGFSYDNHYLAMDRGALRSTLAADGMVPVWSIRLRREATPALFMKGTDFDVPENLKHRSRDVSWLLIGAPGGDRLIVLSDELEPWAERKHRKMASPTDK